MSNTPWAAFRDEAIVYEDEDLIVVDKPPGVPSQAARETDSDDLPSRLRRFLAERRNVPEAEVYLGTHQRLDRETSGLILYTLRKSANASIAEQFAARTIEKSYLVGVEVGEGASLPSAARELVNHLAPGRDGRVEVSTASDARAKRALTRVRVLEREGSRALLEATIETGRTHQIRAQLAHAGWPVAGDVLYDGRPASRLMLHAQRLSFALPSGGRRITLEAKRPLELERWLARGAQPPYDDPELLERLLRNALEARFAFGQELAAGTTTAFRLVHEEADGLPGVAVDVYSQWLVLRELGELSEPAERTLLDALDALGFRGVYVKRHPRQANDLVDPRDERVAPAAPLRGEPAAESFEVFEHGLPFEVRLHDGLRTGLFLDQRDNRQRVRELAAGKRVLNLFSYTGSFSIAALAGGATLAVSVDTSRAALEWAQRNAERIGAGDRHRFVVRDAFDALASFSAREERFDLVIVDPPSYSTSKRGRFRVTKDYAGLCGAALRVLAPGGQLLACLNHHGVSQAMLRRFVHEGAREAGLTVQALRDLPAPRDFPSAPRVAPPAKSVLAIVDPAPAGTRASHSRQRHGRAPR